MPTSSDPKASSRLFDITPLENDGTNFATWKFRVRTVLEIRGLMGITDGTEPKPTASASDPKDTEIANWVSRDRDARAQITLTLKDEPLNSVMYATSAKDTWDRLKDRYEGKGKQTIAYLIGELFRKTLEDDSPLGPQMDAMVQKGHLITSLGQTLDDSLIAIAIIISLPTSYATLKTILMSSDATVSSEKVVTQVLREEQDRHHGADTVALVARQGYGNGKGQQGKGYAKSSTGDARKRVKCDYCKKNGHTKDVCRKLEADKAKAAPKDLSANVAASGLHELATRMVQDTPSTRCAEARLARRRQLHLRDARRHH